MLLAILTVSCRFLRFSRSFRQHFGADGGLRAEVIRGFHPANREEKSTELGECGKAPDGRCLFPCCEVVLITALGGRIASSCSAGYNNRTGFHTISSYRTVCIECLQCVQGSPSRWWRKEVREAQSTSVQKTILA